MTEAGDQSVDSSEAFSLVASETRFAVLQALWDLTAGTETSTVSFAQLRRESDVDDSGQFNYHLDQLTPQFVRKVDGEYTDLETTMEPRPVGDCPECDGTVVLGYEDGHMVVDCRGCETRVADMQAPPVLVATADPEELPELLGKHLLTEIQRMNRGFCLHCGGPLEGHVERDDDGRLRDSWNVSFTCQVCGHVSYSLVSGTVADHPAVVSLLHEAGIDIRETPLWDVDPILDATERIGDEEPLRVETTIGTDHAALTLTLDADLDVVSYDRRDGADTG
jgi:uncharacterized protein YuzB (UPF0349 family)